MSTKAPTSDDANLRQAGREGFFSPKMLKLFTDDAKKISEHEHLFPPNLALLLHRQDQRVTITDSPVIIRT